MTAFPWSLQLPRGRPLIFEDPPLVMGILNLTPDSFSDGGLWPDPEQAIAQGLRLLAEGADLLDLGAESTRPGGGVYGAGAAMVPLEEELARLLPVLQGLRAATDAPLSVDTRKGAVARAALAAGADLINDVGGLQDAELMAAVVAAGCPVVVMHSRGELGSMQREIAFGDVVSEVCAELGSQLARGVRAGIAREQIILDPGIGFGKTAQQNLELLRHLDRLQTWERPLLVGASRKSFIGQLSGALPRDRLGGSLAAVAWAAQLGAAMVRVHDVAATVEFLQVFRAIEHAWGVTAENSSVQAVQ